MLLPTLLSRSTTLKSGVYILLLCQDFSCSLLSFNRNAGPFGVYNTGFFWGADGGGALVYVDLTVQNALVASVTWERI
jgi:hypothetical protein